MTTRLDGDKATVVKAIAAVAETIRELGQIPSGHLYAQVLGFMSFESYGKVIGVLKGSGLVEETPTHLLRWVGPVSALATRTRDRGGWTGGCRGKGMKTAWIKMVNGLWRMIDENGTRWTVGMIAPRRWYVQGNTICSCRFTSRREAQKEAERLSVQESAPCPAR